MQTVRFGVIGLGRFGEIHCEALDALPGVELYALCTRTESRLSELADRFGVERRFTDYREMLADPTLDAVSIVTMWDQHAEPAVAALQAGKHVFLEKPMASTVEDCRRIVAAAEESDKAFMVGHVCRFNPRFAQAKAEIEAGRTRRIISLYARRNLPMTVTESVLEKIGPIAGDAVHDTDLMLWYTGDVIASVYAQTVQVRDKPHPDMAWTMYRFAGGAVGVVETVWCLPGRSPYRIDERMEIVGTEGSLHIQETHPNFAVCDAEGWQCPETTYWPKLHGERAGALREEFTYFTRCIREGRKPGIITPRESLEATRACLAAEESAASGRPVALD